MPETMDWVVSLPDLIRNDGSWVDVDFHWTREEAIEYAKKTFGADDEGRISLVSFIGEEGGE